MLPARFDDTPLPGLLAGMAAVDLRHNTPGQFANLVAAKLASLAAASPGGLFTLTAPADDTEGTGREDTSGTLGGHTCGAVSPAAARRGPRVDGPAGRPAPARAAADSGPAVTPGPHPHRPPPRGPLCGGLPDGRLLATAGNDDAMVRLWIRPLATARAPSSTTPARSGMWRRPGRAAARHRRRRRDGAAVSTDHRVTACAA